MKQSAQQATTNNNTYQQTIIPCNSSILILIHHSSSIVHHWLTRNSTGKHGVLPTSIRFSSIFSFNQGINLAQSRLRNVHVPQPSPQNQSCLDGTGSSLHHRPSCPATLRGGKRRNNAPRNFKEPMKICENPKNPVTLHYV